MRSDWIREGPKPNENVLVKDKRGLRKTQRKRPCGGSRDWRAVTLPRDTKDFAGSPQTPGGSHGMGSPTESSEGTDFANTLNLDFWPPELQEKKFLVF